MAYGTPTAQQDFIDSEASIGPNFNPGTALAQRQDLISLPMPIGMPNRRIWGFTLPRLTAPGDWFLQCILRFYEGGTEVGELPLSRGVSSVGGTTVIRSLATIGGGNLNNELENGLYVTLANPPDASNLAYQIVPFSTKIVADKITASIQNFANITDARVYLAIQSWI